MNRVLRAYVLGLFALAAVSLRAQMLPALPCSSPPPAGAESCELACVYCNFDGYTGVNNGTPSGGDMVCNQINIHNDQWFGFVAGSTSISINVATSNCQVGDGLQTAFFAACNAPALACNPGGSDHAGLPLTMTYSNFVPGQTYYLMVDGFVADVCTYTIQVLSGSVSPPAVGVPAAPQGPASACPGTPVVYSVPPVPGAGWYRWTAPTGASINGGGNTATVAAPAGTQVTVTFGTAGGSVCVEAGNACSAPQQACRMVSVTPALHTTLPAATYCATTLPYTWPEAPYPVLDVPGTYTLTSAPYPATGGCDSTVGQTITILPAQTNDLGTLYRCPGQCFTINGQVYCSAGGPYTEIFPTADGCDSVVTFSLSYATNAAVIAPADTLTCAHPAIVLDGTGSAGTTYRWFDPTGTPLGEQATQAVTAPGMYRLEISTLAGATTCRDTAAVIVAADFTPPLVTATGDTIDCQPDHQDVALLAFAMPPTATVHWSGPGLPAAGVDSLAPRVTVPGTYTVVATNPANGCTAAAGALVTVDTVAPLLAVADATLTCTDTAVALAPVTDAAAPTYLWSGPQGFASTLPVPTVTAAGLYQLTVTDAANGCSATAVASVAQQATPPAIILPLTATLTCVQPTLELTAATPAPSAILWTWFGPGIDTAAQHAAQQTIGQPGVYIVTARDTVTGCQATATIAVMADTLAPIAVAGPPGTLDCLTSSCTLTAAMGPAGAPVVFSWDGPGIAGAQQYEATPTVTLPGTYALLVRDTVNGCTASATTHVTLNATAPPANAGADALLNCTLTSVTLGTTGTPGIWPTWQGPGIDSTNRHTVTPMVALPGLYVLTATDTLNHCTATDTVWIGSNTTTPAAAAGPDRVLTCVTTSVALDGSASSAGPAIRGSWTGPGLPLNGIDSYTAAVDLAGVYVLTLTDTVSQCLARDTAVVLQDIMPPLATAGPDRVLTCHTSVATLDPTGSSAGVRFSWQWQGPGLSGPMNVQTPLVVTGPGLYQLEITDLVNGCTATAAVRVWPDTLRPVGLEFEVERPRCHGESSGRITVMGVEGGQPPFTIVLRDAAGNELTADAQLPAGTYLLSLEDGAGCRLDTAVAIADPAPLTVELGPAAALVLGDSVWLQAMMLPGTPLHGIEWLPAPDFCAGAPCTGFWAYPTETYRQRLTVRDSNGCQATAEKLIIVEKKRRVYVPNVFAPNSLQNGSFAVACGPEVERIRLLDVYDRWGALVFHVQDMPPNVPLAAWDGCIAGRPAAAGVYVYRLEVVFRDGEQEGYSGSVTVVRGER